MKISKFVQTIKNTGHCVVYHTTGAIYLSNGHGIYEAPGFPDITGVSQIAAVLDMDPKKLQKIHVEERHSLGRYDIDGFDFTEDTSEEMDANKIDVAAVLDGKIYAALRCKSGQLLFFDESLLAPINDKIKDAENYVNYAVRTHRGGDKYIVVKDGLFEILAAILPTKVLSEQYIAHIHSFYCQCERQYKLELRGINPEDEEQAVQQEEAEDNE